MTNLLSNAAQEPTRPTIEDWGVGTAGAALGLVVTQALAFGGMFLHVTSCFVYAALAILIGRQLRYSRRLYLPEHSIVFLGSICLVAAIPSVDTLNNFLHQSEFAAWIPPETHFDFWRWTLAWIAFSFAAVAICMAITLRSPQLFACTTLLWLLAWVMLGFVARVHVNHAWFSFPASMQKAPPFLQACLSEIAGSCRQTPTVLPLIFFAIASFYSAETERPRNYKTPRLWIFRVGQVYFGGVGMLCLLAISIAFSNLNAGEVLPFLMIRIIWVASMALASIHAIRAIAKYNWPHGYR